MKNKYKRLIKIICAVILFGGLIFIVVDTFNKNMVFFYSPSELPKTDNIIKLGGMVKEGSFNKETPGNYEFIVTDYKQEIIVYYKGVLPDLFREGQGVVATGKVINNKFYASEILAKHDEKYMPKEVYDALKKSKL